MDVQRLRRLVVLRHAKSDWPPGVPDHDRPLGPRGRRDAPAAGRWLHHGGCVPDQVVCSTARRARETWDLAAAELGAVPDVRFDERVYDATVAELLLVAHEFGDDSPTALLVGHNPGFHDLAMTLTGSADGDALEKLRAKFPTSGIAVLAFTGPWTALGAGTARLTHVAAPRG